MEQNRSFARGLPVTMTRRPSVFAMGTAIWPKLPEPPGISRVSPGFASNSSTMA